MMPKICTAFYTRKMKEEDTVRLLFIRHGDPDYEHDTLTEKGHREAALLGKLAPSLNLGQCFVSPLGRARHTAEYCLKSTGKQAQELKWLQEFPGTVDINHSPELQEAYPDCRKKGDRYELRIPGIWCPPIILHIRNIWTGKDGGILRRQGAAIRCLHMTAWQRIWTDCCLNTAMSEGETTILYKKKTRKR